MSWQDRLSDLISDLYEFAAAQCAAPLVASVEELSHEFNDLRRFRREDYFAKARARSAYLGYFAPKNVVRMALLLDLLQEEGKLADLPDSPSVLDLGSGPLVGLLAFHARFAPSAPRYMAVDQSRQMLKAGRQFFAQQFPETERLKTVSGNLKAPSKSWGPREPVDLILVGNVLNEFGDPKKSLEVRKAFLERTSRFLKPNGYLLLVEPAQRVASQGLSHLRDEWRGGKFLELRAPCVALAKCPMGPQSKNWCHTSFHWRHPANLFQLIQKLGFQANPLSLSYSLWQKSSRKIATSGVRLVSNPVNRNRKTEVMACGETNELISINAKNIEGNVSIARGRLATQNKDSSWKII